MRLMTCAVCGEQFGHGEPWSKIRDRKYCGRACYRTTIKFTPEQAAERFWSRVNKGGENGCWLFMGARDKWGYGDLVFDSKHVQAHRLAWRLLRSEPGKMDVLHKCNNPPCCNPDHLYLGDDFDNTRDRILAGNQPIIGKLTPEQIAKIRAEYRCVRAPSGKIMESNAKELAAKYGVVKATIAHVALGHTWKHVP